MSITSGRPEWHTDPDGVSYPPEPWRLSGELFVSTLIVDRRRLPGSLLAVVPQRHRLIAPGGSTFVGVAFVDYAPTGDLAYRELLVAIPTLSRRGLRYSIPSIWVDSAESRAGGRALWGIPKELGTFDWSRGASGVDARLAIAGVEVAAMAATSHRSLPGRWSMPLNTSQQTDRGEIHSNNTVRARIGVARARWSFAAGGPLSYLSGCRVVASVHLSDASICFGGRR